MSDRAPYSRIYWSVIHDERFEGVYTDDGAFALWVRLLMHADAMWPSPAPLPRSAKARGLARLVAAGIIDLLPGDHYRIHGLDSERERRRSVARNEPQRDPNGRQTGPEREANGSQAKPSQAEPSTSQAEAPRDPADIYWQLTGKYPGDKVLPWIDDLTRQYGAESVIRHLVEAHVENRDVATLLGRVKDRLRAEARQLDRKEREAEQAALREKRAQPRTVEPWREEYRAAIERHYAETGGAGL